MAQVQPLVPGVVSTVRMVKAKETKGTFMYSNEDDGVAIPTLYIRKTAFRGQPAPDSINVTVTAG